MWPQIAYASAGSALNYERDIAPVVAFLLSEDSAWIQGANIAVDGGMQAQALVRQHGLCDAEVSTLSAS